MSAATGDVHDAVQAALTAVKPGDVAAALEAASAFEPAAHQLAHGSRSAYLATLRALGRFDLTTARAIEPHLDAVAILDQADVDVSELVAESATRQVRMGVFASRAPQLRGVVTDGTWTLTGVKPWCSLAGSLSHALVTAGTDEGQRLFFVDLEAPGVRIEDANWVSRGLRNITTGSVHFDSVAVQPVGPAGFYLNRPGLAWGGIGVAAVWAGGMDRLHEAYRRRLQQREADQIAWMIAGQLDAVRYVVDLALENSTSGDVGALEAARVRAVVADAVERTQRLVGHGMGPGPLTGDEEFSRCMADLTVYVRQHHAERDFAALGQLAVQGRNVG